MPHRLDSHGRPDRSTCQYRVFGLACGPIWCKNAAMAAPMRIGGRALADLLPDLHAMPGPVYDALARAISMLVLDGRITTETRLPSERELASALRLSRATVTAAYDELRSTGYLASRTGAGSFVTVPSTSEPRATLARWTSTPVGTAADVIDLSC